MPLKECVSLAGIRFGLFVTEVVLRVSSSEAPWLHPDKKAHTQAKKTTIFIYTSLFYF